MDSSDHQPKKLYTRDDIQVLRLIDGIRRRPAMYIGEIDERGLQHLAEELIDRSLDAFLNHQLSRIDIILRADGGIVVTDDGPGLPVSEEHPSVLEETCENFERYQRVRRFRHIGIPVVVALSERFTLSTMYAGCEWRVLYRHGELAEPTREIGPSTDHGTKATHYADRDIFRDSVFPREAFREQLLTTSFLNPGLTIRFSDEMSGERAEFCHRDGVGDFVRHLGPAGSEVVRLSTAIPDIEFDLAFRIVCDNAEHRNYANGYRYDLGGACWGIIHGVADTLCSSELDIEFQPNVDWLRKHMVSVVALEIENPMYEGPTRAKLSNPGLAELTREVTRTGLKHTLQTNQTIRRSIIKFLNYHAAWDNS